MGLCWSGDGGAEIIMFNLFLSVRFSDFLASLRWWSDGVEILHILYVAEIGYIRS